MQNVQSVDHDPYVCAIYTESGNTKLESDQVTLSIHVKPELKVSVEKDWIAENDNATITCSTQRVKPSVTNMVIKIGTGRVESEPHGINETKKDDKTFVNSFSALIPVNRSDNGNAVSCEAMWKGPMNTKTINSNTETLRVVWPADTPEDIKVVPGLESCDVSWRSDQNAKNVTICHEPSSGGQQCTTLTTTESPRYKMVKLDPGENYSIWMYASNKFGSSDNTTKQQCIPQATTTMGPTTTASSTNDNGLNLAVVVGGTVGGVMGIALLIIIVIIVRKKLR